MAIGVNKDLVATAPTKWDDLLTADYANAFALTGDPRASNQAILAIMAAGRILALGAPVDIKKQARSEQNPDPTMEDAFIWLIQKDDAGEQIR